MAITAAQLQVQFTETGSDAVVGALNAVDNAIKTTSSGFEQLYDGVRGFADAFGRVGLAGGVALFTKGAMAAWKQVDAVEQATIALRAYEKDAQKVDDVLENLLRFARSDAGKLFLREELFSAAQALKVAGAETENLTRYVEIMARSVSTGMATWNDLERVLTRVGSTGRLTTIEFELLQQAGYQLDESLRNTTVTWEELFDALERGSVTVEGQTETIQGRLMTLSTAIRSIGTAFLGVDSETSQFVEGALGSRLVGGIDMAIAALERLRPAAAMIGQAFTLVIDAVTGLAQGFGMLPGPVQAVLAGIVGAVAAFGMLRQAIALTSTAMRAMGLGAFTAMFTPLGAAIAGVALVGGLLVKSYMDQKQAAEEYRQSVTDLEMALETLRRQGDTQLADAGERLSQMFNNDQINEFTEQVEQGEYVLMRFKEEFGRDFVPGQDDSLLRPYIQQWQTDWADFNNEMMLARENLSLNVQEMTDLNLKLRDALTDPNIDAQAWITWATTLLQSAENAEELRAAFDLIMETPLSDFARHATDDINDLNDAMRVTHETLGTFNDRLNEAMATARDEADGINTMEEAVASLVAGLEDGSIAIDDFAAKKAEADRRLAEGLLINPELALAQYEQDLINIAIGYEEAADSADRFREASENAMSGAIQKAQEARDEIAELRDAFMEGLFEFANIDFAKQINLAGLGTDATHAAQSINEVGAALDSVLAVYGQIDAMGNRMRAAGGIADALFGEGGDPADGVGPLRDVFDAGLISVEQFNSAIEDGIAIQAAAADSELYLNKMRADQLPLLRQTTEAYQEQIKAISELGAQEQMVALGWMDTGMQGRVQQFTDMVSMMGRLGPQGAEAMQQIIDGIVATDPVLTAMLEDLGLIEQQLDGSYTLDLDAAGAVSEIQMLNTTLGHLIDTLKGDELGTYELKIKAELDLSALEGGAGWVGEGIGRAITIPVSADTGPAALELNAFEEDASTPITVPVEFDWGGAAGFVGGGIAGALGAFDSGLEIAASVTVDTSGADGAIESVETNLAALDGSTASITVDGDASGAMDAITAVATNLGMIDGQQANVSILGDASDAVAAVSEAATNLGMIDGAQAWIYIMGDNSHAAGVIQAMAGYNGMVLATAYVDVVARQIGSGQAIAQGIVAGARQGLGIHSPSREFAEIGKYTAMGFQQGWEREFENPSIGLSTAAAYSGYGTVAPSGASGNGTYAPTINVTVNAETNADADEIAQTVSRVVMPALADEFRRHTTAHSEVMA